MTTIIEVEIYFKEFQNNVLQIHCAKATTAEKTIIANELLGHRRQDMQSITEPIGKSIHLKLKLNATINIQEKYLGKDVLKIPRENQKKSSLIKIGTF